jgi:DNA-binding IclR family transcriptional regulator
MATPQILSVARAFRILSSFNGARGRLTPKEIAQRVGMNYKTVHRFLLTLEQFGAVTRLGRSEFTLGMFLADLGHKVSLNRTLWNASMPELELIVEEFRECAQVATLHNGEAMSVAHLPADRPHSSGIRIGQRLPLHCTAVGKVLAAGMDDEKLQSISKILRMEQKTVSTIVTRPALLKEIVLVRTRGFALNDEEWVAGLRAIAVPIFSRPGKVLAAISLSGPVSRMTPAVLKNAQSRLAQCAGRISTAIYEKSKEPSEGPARPSQRIPARAGRDARAASGLRSQKTQFANSEM